jgi:hypothetical protein
MGATAGAGVDSASGGGGGIGAAASGAAWVKANANINVEGTIIQSLFDESTGLSTSPPRRPVPADVEAVLRLRGLQEAHDPQAGDEVPGVIELHPDLEDLGVDALGGVVRAQVLAFAAVGEKCNGSPFRG